MREETGVESKTSVFQRRGMKRSGIYLDATVGQHPPANQSWSIEPGGALIDAVATHV
jgi:hypothetical protein